MSDDSYLSQLRIASPCRERWEGMEGDDRVRFCGRCEKHVYNIAELTEEKAREVIEQQEGTPCIRMRLRHDGTVLNGNCPVGERRWWRRLATAAAGLILLALTPVTALTMPLQLSAAVGSINNRWGNETERLLDRLHRTLGFDSIYGSVIMGEMCIPPVAPQPAALPDVDTSEDANS
ncbi:hypothetical protein [Calycomorphotria hydatis]|uniref:Uncharacterized protein n=1 Tax=Calycomorphotria hydatis TaxID=2528027 RepID=A0A517T5Q2_9PLAN|nr:hypothetical protein [Calycomorphotria hydatis]QDT63681.1 hypothetical protein V22_09050 [Calycomorphotria hydatis]